MSFPWLHACTLAIAAAQVDEPRRAYCNDLFGHGIVSPGDLDGDGFDDLLVTAAGQREAGSSREGAVFAFSGRDGSVLYTVWNDRQRRRPDLGRGAIALVGDMNRDRVPYFVETVSDSIRSGRDGARLATFTVSSPLAVTGVGDSNGDGAFDIAITDGIDDRCSVVRIVCGADGAQLREIHGPCGGEFGFALDSGVDVDGDGVLELLVGSPRGAEDERQSPTARGGIVRCISLATGCELWDVEARAPGDRFGETAKWIGDVDRDGHADFAVGAPGLDLYGIRRRPDCGYVRVFSGNSRVVLCTIDGPRNATECPVDSSFGHSLASAGDVDGDGTFDLVVGAPREGVLLGSARAYSGRTGKVVHAFVGPLSRLSDWGANVSCAGDIDADGVSDLAVVSMNESEGAANLGVIALFSGVTGELLRSLRSPLMRWD